MIGVGESGEGETVCVVGSAVVVMDRGIAFFLGRGMWIDWFSSASDLGISAL